MYLDGTRYQRNGNTQNWTVDRVLKRHLEQCFEWGFHNVVPLNKKIYLALDVSGSMGMGSCYEGVQWMTPRVVSAALANLFLRTEEDVICRGFQDKLVDLRINKDMSLDETVRRISNLSFGGTDCSQPMLDALQKKEMVDLFVVMTDNETWAGRIHPFEALNRYRRAMNPRAKLAVLGMTVNEFTIADPNCDYMLDIAGVDSNIYDVLRGFAVEGDEE
jgi:60 kDa SS-A/Ro ribonucleoprotein